MQELLRSVDVVAMANWAQLVNVLGAIKTSRTAVCLDPAGHVLALYRARLRGVLIPIALAGNAPVDAVAAFDKETGALSLGLINFSPSQGIELTIRLGDAAPQSAAGWRIDGPALGATNLPGQPEAVTTTPLEGISLAKPISLPAHSITVLELKTNR